MIGQLLLGKYKVTRPLDEGGMSKIYVARQHDPPREVVVKMLKDALKSQTKAVEHFRREIFIMSRVKHPNMVEVIDSSTRDLRGPILVMELLKGTDLSHVLQKESRLGPERAGRLLGQLCSVLQHIHDANILHRDLKPGNVMVLDAGTPRETLKLMDFGLAKMLKVLYISPEEIAELNSCAASGTPEYISPEMVRGHDMDHRSDLYSVGVMMYEMLTGRRPFHDADVESLMVAHAKSTPPPFASIGVSDVPAGVERVVMECLAKFPEQRPDSATELAERYGKALGRPILPTEASAQASGIRPFVGTPSAQGLLARGPDEVGGNAIRHSLEAHAPEAMAMLKIKGFIFDLGGEVVESVPGVIRVRLQGERPAAKSGGGGLLGWLTGGSGPRAATAAPAIPATDLDLHMERRSGASGPLTITLTMKPLGGLASPEWRERCAQVARDLKAYMGGR
jgi:serine/threonine-protein kinase